MYFPGTLGTLSRIKIQFLCFYIFKKEIPADDIFRVFLCYENGNGDVIQ